MASFCDLQTPMAEKKQSCTPHQTWSSQEEVLPRKDRGHAFLRTPFTMGALSFVPQTGGAVFFLQGIFRHKKTNWKTLVRGPPEIRIPTFPQLPTDALLVAVVSLELPSYPVAPGSPHRPAGVLPPAVPCTISPPESAQFGASLGRWRSIRPSALDCHLQHGLASLGVFWHNVAQFGHFWEAPCSGPFGFLGFAPPPLKTRGKYPLASKPPLFAGNIN